MKGEGAAPGGMGEGEVEAEQDWGEILSCSGCPKTKFNLEHKHLFFSSVFSFLFALPTVQIVCAPAHWSTQPSLWYLAGIALWLLHVPCLSVGNNPPHHASMRWWFEGTFLEHIWVPSSFWEGFSRKRGDPTGGLGALNAGEGMEGPG